MPLFVQGLLGGGIGEQRHEPLGRSTRIVPVHLTNWRSGSGSGLSRGAILELGPAFLPLVGGQGVGLTERDAPCRGQFGEQSQ